MALSIGKLCRLIGLILALAVPWLPPAPHANAGGKLTPFRDDVPDIDERELDLFKERMEEVQQRLQGLEPIPIPDEASLPSESEIAEACNDYRDAVPPLCPQELEYLQKAIEKIAHQVQSRKPASEQSGKEP